MGMESRGLSLVMPIICVVSPKQLRVHSNYVVASRERQTSKYWYVQYSTCLDEEGAVAVLHREEGVRVERERERERELIRQWYCTSVRTACTGSTHVSEKEVSIEVGRIGKGGDVGEAS